MTWIRKLATAWKKDQVLARVVRNSGWLFASNIISAVLSIITANMLGVEQFGALGIIMALVSNVNRLLSFRMGDFIVRYLADALAQQDKTKAAALSKGCRAYRIRHFHHRFHCFMVVSSIGSTLYYS